MRSLLHTHIRKERERERERERVLLVCSSQIITSWVCACLLAFFLSLRACCLCLDFLSLIGVVSSSSTGSDGWVGGGGGVEEWVSSKYMGYLLLCVTVIITT